MSSFYCKSKAKMTINKRRCRCWGNNNNNTMSGKILGILEIQAVNPDVTFWGLEKLVAAQEEQLTILKAITALRNPKRKQCAIIRDILYKYFFLIYLLWPKKFATTKTS